MGRAQRPEPSVRLRSRVTQSKTPNVRMPGAKLEHEIDLVPVVVKVRKFSCNYGVFRLTVEESLPAHGAVANALVALAPFLRPICTEATHRISDCLANRVVKSPSSSCYSFSGSKKPDLSFAPLPLCQGNLTCPDCNDALLPVLLNCQFAG